MDLPELVQNEGILNKSFKMLPELVPSGCMPVRLFSNDDPGLTLAILMTGSVLFPMLLYG